MTASQHAAIRKQGEALGASVATALYDEFRNGPPNTLGAGGKAWGEITKRLITSDMPRDLFHEIEDAHGESESEAMKEAFLVGFYAGRAMNGGAR